MSVLFPEPLGPSTATTSGVVDAERQALERRGVALRGAVDAKDVAGVDRGRHRALRPDSTATGPSAASANTSER